MATEEGKAAAMHSADDLSQSSGVSLSHDSREGTSSNVIVKKDGSSPKEQMQALFMSRLVVGFVLVLLATAAGLTTFFVATRTQEDYLTTQVRDRERFLTFSQIVLFSYSLDMFCMS